MYTPVGATAYEEIVKKKKNIRKSLEKAKEAWIEK